MSSRVIPVVTLPPKSDAFLLIYLFGLSSSPPTFRFSSCSPAELEQYRRDYRERNNDTSECFDLLLQNDMMRGFEVSHLHSPSRPSDSTALISSSLSLSTLSCSVLPVKPSTGRAQTRSSCDGSIRAETPRLWNFFRVESSFPGARS